MPRLQPELLQRFEGFADRVLHVAASLEEAKVSRRIVDQVIGSGTSVGANVFEADEAMSRADFTKSCSIALKELNETRYWLRMIGRNGWVKPARLEGLEQESLELKRILGSMIARTKRRAS
jgi:four helix bundle protein